MKILMVTMAMGLGGAETHILELSKGLVKMGHEVLLCSNGGVYVKELEEAGIRHIQAPLHIRTRASVSTSIGILRRLIKEERPDIVHAHARIPALLCSELCAHYRVPFVTTAHYNFKTNGLYRYLTRWGEKTIAVSEDLKKYLMENYRLKPQNITVTVNGIATDKFCPEASAGDLYEELDLPRDGQYVCTVSRMDKNACRAAEILIDGAERPCRENERLHVVIVGGGECFEELSRKADTVNRAVGRRCVVMTGGRTDISRFTALCDVFVGVSRSALEAMACGKPTILAGNQGYLGLYSRQVLPQCIATNFTCRGIAYPGEQVVWASVLPLLRKEAPAGLTMEEISRQSREIICTNYSVEKMAQDALNVYESLLRETGSDAYDFVVTGYYGHENSGDEALLTAVIRNLERECPQAKICVLSSAPQSTKSNCSVKAVQRFNVAAVSQVFARSKVLVFGGGNLIQDITSTKSLLYYLFLLDAAKKRGMKTMLYANGIGPIIREKNKQRVVRTLNTCDLITLRDEDSLELLREMNVTGPKIVVTADETLTLPLPEESVQEQFKRKYDLKNEGYMVVSVRPFKTAPPDILTHLAQSLNETATRHGLKVLLLPMHGQTDEQYSQKLLSMLTVSCRCVRHPESLDELMTIIGGSAVTIGMRMHSLVFAACCRVPFIGLAYDPKVKSFTHGFPSLTCFDLQRLDHVVLSREIDRVMNSRQEIVQEMDSKVSVWQRDARQNALLAAELLKEE